MVNIVESNTSFAFSIYQRLRGSGGNTFFSPYSISTARAMTYAGSRGNTEKQIAETLCFQLDQEKIHAAFLDLAAHLNAIQSTGEIQLHVANSIWPQIGYPFSAQYLALLEQCYGVLVTGLDFCQTENARNIINIWVAQKTAEKIKELIAPGMIDSSTTLVLTNAIYFKGNWSQKFDEEQTEDTPFWLNSTENVIVPMMSLEAEFRYAETTNLQILELPYQGSEISLIVLLPKKIDGLAEIEDSLSEKNLKQWTSNLWDQKVRVYLPKFKLESSFELSKTLITMGMPDAFTSLADFSGMDGTTNLYIGLVIHKAFIEVNEEGTEAAAATAVMMRKGLSLPVEFRADHPFLFLIREKTSNSILFLGRMENPAGIAN